MKTKLIKLIVVIICFTSILSCSKNDREFYSFIQINPPEWIQGTWLKAGTGFGWRFTSNDIISIDPNLEFSFRESYQSFIDHGANASISDTYTNVSYIVTINYGGVISTFDFTKLSDTEISEKSDSLAILIKQ
jgi:hypothetical protein